VENFFSILLESKNIEKNPKILQFGHRAFRAIPGFPKFGDWSFGESRFLCRDMGLLKKLKKVEIWKTNRILQISTFSCRKRKFVQNVNSYENENVRKKVSGNLGKIEEILGSIFSVGFSILESAAVKID